MNDCAGRFGVVSKLFAQISEPAVVTPTSSLRVRVTPTLDSGDQKVGLRFEHLHQSFMASLFTRSITGRIWPKWFPVNYTQLCFVLIPALSGWHCAGTIKVGFVSLRETRPQCVTINPETLISWADSHFIAEFWGEKKKSIISECAGWARQQHNKMKKALPDIQNDIKLQ